MEKQGLAQAVQQQARKLWDNYGLQKGYAECEYFAYSNQIFLSVETSNRTTFTVLEDVPISQFDDMTSKDIYIDLLEHLLMVIDDFEPEEKYNELVGDEYDNPEEFKAMLEQDKEELLEKAKEIKLELDKLQVEWCQYHSFFCIKKDLSNIDKSNVSIVNYDRGVANYPATCYPFTM